MAINLIFLMLFAAFLVFGKAWYDFHKAAKHYKITKKADNWVVRDSRGRFVRITDNYWDICNLGASL